MALLDTIKKYANQRGLTLRQVNNKAGLGTNAIYRWKNQKPSFEKIDRVAKVLGVSVDQLLESPTKSTPDPLSYFRIDTSGLDSNEIDEMKSQLAEYSEYLKSKIQKNHQKKDDNE